MKTLIILAITIVANLAFALPTPGIYRCSDLQGQNQLSLVIGTKSLGGKLYKKVTLVKSGVAQPLNPKSVYMSEEEENEFSVWFLDENGNRKSNKPDTYCSLFAARG